MRNKTFYEDSLNIEIKSFTSVNDFIFPLRINIADINHSSTEYNFIKIDLDDKDSSKDILSVGMDFSPFKEEYDLNKYFFELDFIYKFIDWNLYSKEYKTFAETLSIYNERDFREWFLNCDIFSIEDILKIGKEIRYYIDCIKIEFINKILRLFELDKQPPNIRLKDGVDTPKEYTPFLTYNYNMTSFQTASEFPMEIWFPENIGKAYIEQSWREHEAKRMYITAKTRVENFRELVKAKQFEDRQ